MLLYLLSAFACISKSAAIAVDSSRASEIATCAPGEITTWGDGVDRQVRYPALHFLYNPNNAPVWFSSSLVQTLIERAANVWSQCGIVSSVNLGTEPHYLLEGEVLISWNDEKSVGNIGTSDLNSRRLYLSPGVFKTLRERRPNYDAAYTLQMTLSHEMGHFYGLVAHSKRCIDVLSYYKDSRGQSCSIRDRSEFSKVIEYRSPLPTACDIKRCKIINGKSE